MPKLIIEVDFEDEPELEEKLKCLKDQLLDNVVDRATQMPYGTLWQGEDYNLYLIPNGLELALEFDIKEESPNLLDLDEDELRRLAKLEEELGPETGIFAAGALADARLANRGDNDSPEES